MSELQDLYRLQAFVCVVDEGSLTAAVGRLHITQPALSTRLKLLEESLGCILLERTGRGVRPTPMGQLVYRCAKDILARSEQLTRTVRSHLEHRTGWVHLGGGATAVACVLPEAIQSFSARFPEIQFTLGEEDSAEIVSGVFSGRLDLGMMSLRADAASGEEFGEELSAHGDLIVRYVPVAADVHPLVRMADELARAGKRMLPMHLNHQAMVLFDPRTPVAQVLEQELRRLFVHPKVVMTLRSADAVIDMVRRGMGIGFASELELRGAVGIKRLEVEGFRLERKLVVVSARGRALSPAAEAFLDHLLALPLPWNGVGPSAQGNAAPR